VKRQFRLGAVLTETAAEGFLLASVQSDDTPLFVTLNSVAMTRPMHRHIARGPHKKSAVLENTARSLIVGYWPSDLMVVAATPFTILTSMGRAYERDGSRAASGTNLPFAGWYFSRPAAKAVWDVSDPNTTSLICHSITSSARASSEGGTVRLRALAVLRLITNWYLVFCWMGRSTGLAPLRIRPT